VTQFLTPQDIALYNQRKSNIRADYQIGSAKNAFERGQAGLDFLLGQRGLTYQWDQNRSRLPGGFTGRGMLNSGAYQGALQDYGTQRGFAFEGLQRQYDQTLGRLNMERQGMATQKRQGIQTVDAERNARRAQLASQLRGIY
jgi:hypothetical protein